MTTTSYALARLAQVCELGSVESMERLSTGYLNDNYRLTCSTGRYMLKHYRRARPAKVRRERPLGYLHGDFIPNNVLFRDDEIASVLDWERVGVGPRSLELVRATAFWFTDPEDGSLDLRRARAFIEAYSDRHPLHRRELEAMFARFWWDKLNDLWVFHRHYASGDDSADHIAVQTARWLSWWSDRRERLFGALGASALVC